MLFGAERRLALTLQRSLLPAALPELPGIELAARYLPGTGGRDVGGDFYIGHPLEDGRLLLVIGDVMGHGAAGRRAHGPAARRARRLRLRRRPARPRARPPQRARAGAARPADGDRRWPAIYDPETRRLTFSLAGHLPPLIAPLDGAPAFAAARPARRWAPGVDEYERHAVDVPPARRVVLYTDGLIEDRTRADRRRAGAAAAAR